nr:NAD(P)H-hydrate dehydratase [Tissierella sp.]
MRDLLKRRKAESHKGNFGRAAVIGGSTGMTGAAYMASLSALRTGAGYSYTLVPEKLETIMSIKLTESIIRPIEDGGRGHFTMESLQDILKYTKDMDALAIGTGMGVDGDRTYLVKEIIRNAKVPMVLDADGINCISENPHILEGHEKPVIITPHPGELSKFLDVSIENIQEKRVYYSEYVAKKYNVIVVLKGHRTVVASPKLGIYINETGNPGMATAGSGDVLTGMIVSLLAQGLKPFDAARLGVHLHGIAGDIARNNIGEYGMIASDIIENIPKAINAYNFKDDK